MKKLILFITILASGIGLIAQECSDLFISEYVEGSGNNKAIELYNPTNEAIDLSGYQLVRYSNGEFEPADVGLTGTIESKSTFVVVLDKRDPNGTGYEQPIDSALMEKADLFLCPVYEVNKMMYFNGNDAVTLETTTGNVVDVFGKIGPPMTSDDNGWGNLNDTTITYNSAGNPTTYTISNYIVGPLFWLSWTEDNTLIRKTDVTFGVTSNPEPYFIVDQQWDSLPENTFDSLGAHYCDCTSANINEQILSAEISVYPNPVTNNVFTVSSSDPIEMVKMFDLTGRVHQQVEFNTMIFSGDFTIADNFEGVLFVTVKTKSGVTRTRKLIAR